LFSTGIVRSLLTRTLPQLASENVRGGPDADRRAVKSWDQATTGPGRAPRNGSFWKGDQPWIEAYRLPGGCSHVLWALPSLPTRLPLNGSIEGSVHEPRSVATDGGHPIGTSIPTKRSASWFGYYSTMHAVGLCQQPSPSSQTALAKPTAPAPCY
jgi:hypothetical protein